MSATWTPRQRWILFAVLVTGVALRGVHVASSLGTPDSLTWYHNVELIERGGVAGAYLLDPGANHPPLAMAFAQAANRAAAALGCEFIDAFRGLQTLADLVTALLLARLAGTYAASMFMLSPAAIFISGFHCQSDPLMTMFLVLAVVCSVERRGGAAGAAIACAAGIKIIALVALPLLILVFARKPLARFAAMFVVTTAAIYAPATILTHEVVWRNVFLYTGPLAGWGWILLFGRRVRIAVVVMLLVSLGLLWLHELIRRKALRDDRSRIVKVVGTALCLVLFFAPGFGVQYLFWPLPFLALLVDRRVALVAHGVVSAWLFAIYTAWAGGWPWWWGDQKASLPLIRAGLAVWLMLGIVAVLTVRELWRRRYSSSSSPPSPPAFLYFLVLL